MSYQGINKHRDRIEIMRHNLTEPVVFRQLVPLLEASLLSFLSVLDSDVLIRKNTKSPEESRALVDEGNYNCVFRAIKPREHRYEIFPFI